MYEDKEIDINKVDISKVWLLENVHCLCGQIERLCKARSNRQHSTIKFESGSIDTLLHVVDMNPGITIIYPLFSDKRFNRFGCYIIHVKSKFFQGNHPVASLNPYIKLIPRPAYQRS